MNVTASDASDWVEPVARAGYAAKAAVYAVIGGLAAQQAFTSGGDTAGSSEALQQVRSSPFGMILLGLLAAGLFGYVIWRLVQAFVDPEADEDDSGLVRAGTRAFYFVSGALYGLLAYQAVQLLFGSGSGGGAGGGGSTRSMAGALMEQPWGAWLVAAVGVGIIARGVLQLVKAYTESFREKIRSFDLGPAKNDWIITASRVGLTARAVIFGIIGGFLVYAGYRHDPEQARGLEGALDTLAGNPFLLGAIAIGVICYAVYQFTKARYRLIGV